MRTLLTLFLALAAPIAASAEPCILSFDDLVTRMSEGGKRSFLYQEETALRFNQRRVHSDTDVLAGPKVYEAGLEILKASNLAAITLPSGSIKIVTADSASKETLRVISSYEGLPDTEEFCTLTVSLRFARARDILAPIQSLISDPRNVMASESTNTVVISDYASNLKKLSTIIERMDVGRADSTWRISVAVLQGSDAGTPVIPEAFAEAGLEKATGRNAFSLLGDGMATLTLGGKESDRSPSGLATVRLWGGEKLVADFRATVASEGSLTFENLVISSTAEEGKTGATLLQTRLSLKSGTWTVAGTLAGTTGKDTSLKVVLVKVEPVK